MRNTALYLGLLVYAICCAAIITYLGVRFDHTNGLGFVSSVLYGIATCALAYAFLRNRATKTNFLTLFFAAAVGPIAVIVVAFCGFISLLVIGLAFGVADINIGLLGGVFGLAIVIAAGSAGGGLLVLSAAYTFLADITKGYRLNFSILWVVFCAIYPFLLIPFVDLTPLNGFFNEAGHSGIWVNHLLLAKLFFPWQAVTLFMLGVLFTEEQRKRTCAVLIPDLNEAKVA